MKASDIELSQMLDNTYSEIRAAQDEKARQQMPLESERRRIPHQPAIAKSKPPILPYINPKPGSGRSGKDLKPGSGRSGKQAQKSVYKARKSLDVPQKNSLSSLENPFDNRLAKHYTAPLLTPSRSHKQLFPLRKTDSNNPEPKRPRSQNFLSLDLDNLPNPPTNGRANKTSIRTFPILDRIPKPGSTQVIRGTPESSKHSLEAPQGSERNSLGNLPKSSSKKLLFFADGTTKLVDNTNTPKLTANTINNWDQEPKGSAKCLHDKAKSRLVKQMSRSVDRIVLNNGDGDANEPVIGAGQTPPIGDSQFKNQLHWGGIKKFDLIKEKDGTTKLKYKK